LSTVLLSLSYPASKLSKYLPQINFLNLYNLSSTLGTMVIISIIFVITKAAINNSKDYDLISKKNLNYDGDN
jgi:hypothetical protein